MDCQDVIVKGTFSQKYYIITDGSFAEIASYDVELKNGERMGYGLRIERQSINAGYCLQDNRVEEVILPELIYTL